MRSRSEWIRVSKSRPCPICGHHDWCGLSPEGAVICMRTESPIQTKNGGWLHKTETNPSPVRTFRPPPPPIRTNTNFAEMIEEWQRITLPVSVAAMAARLGVRPDAMDAIGIAKAPQDKTWAFPMKDGHGGIIGIRLRSEDGRKWAVTGSKAGLIYGRITDGGTLLICEGPTDTAAAISIGFQAIGRPSCRGTIQPIIDFLANHRRTCPVIVADQGDPGISGAFDLAEKLNRPCRIVLPPAKDLREWVKTGATKQHVMALIESAKWRNMR